MGALPAPWRAGFESGFEPYILGLAFQLCDFERKLKEAGGGKHTIHVCEDVCGEPYEEAG